MHQASIDTFHHRPAQALVPAAPTHAPAVAAAKDKARTVGLVAERQRQPRPAVLQATLPAGMVT